MHDRRTVGLAAAVMMLVAAGAFGHTPPDHARVFFVGIENGQIVESPFKVRFGIEGFGIVPAGTKDKSRHDSGHHHLLVNVDTLPDMDAPIPRDSRHLHFDAGETEAVLDLRSGRHTLQLLLGDEEHEPQDPPLISERITVIVK